MRIIFFLGVFSLVSPMDAQFFPFTNLRHLVEHKSEERQEPSVTSPTIDNNLKIQLEDEPEQRKTEEPLGVTTGSPNDTPELSTVLNAQERTVVVTPKPKYAPQRLVPEPKIDPNSDLVPSMGYKPSSQHHQQPQPVRSLTINPPPDQPQHTSEQTVRFSTVVESVPSLSVTIQDDSSYKRKLPDGIVDYLVPPKYPSVYESVGLLPTTSSNQIGNDDNRSTDNQKTQKRKKNRNKVATYSPYKDDQEDAEKAGSTKIRTVRPQRLRPIHVPSMPVVKVTASPSTPRKKIRSRPTKSARPNNAATTQGETDDNDSSASSTSYLKPTRPHHEFPFDDQEVAQSSFGLAGSTGERVEFQMHGQSGPESYKFGFDTGEGKNRHFRYEEKDGHGNVKGHYGYYDKSGKLQVVNYHADKHGFHANAA